MLLWAYWSGWVSLVEIWESDPDYNHGFLVIPISLWLLWQRRDRLATLEISPSWWGLGLIVVAGLLRWFGAEFFIPQFEVWSIPLWIAGVVLLFGGWSLLKWSGGAIAFLWFMTPLPASMTDFISLPLQKLSAVISTWTLHLCAQPAVRSGTTISLGEQVLDVERACSGLRITYGIMALAVAYVVLMRPGLLRSIVLLAVAIPVALLANSARVTVTGLLFLVVSGETAHKYAHDFSGLLMLPFAVGLLWLVHWTMEKFIGAYRRSTGAGNLLVLKSGLAILVLATGMILWQRRQAEAAIGTLLKIAERHEANGQKSQDDKNVEQAVQEWAKAATFLDRYCRVRPEDAAAAERLAVASERLAFSRPGLVRAARQYDRAWSLHPDDNALGFKQTRLALAGEESPLALAGAEKLLQKTDPGSPEHLAAFQLKVRAQLQDVDRPNSATTWTQVAETLKHGISSQLDAVQCCYQLAVVYRQHPVDSIPMAEREAAAEQVFVELLTERADDPQAWFARYAFHQFFPAPDTETLSPAGADSDASSSTEPGTDPAPESTTTENPSPTADVRAQSPDEDLNRAVELAQKSLTPETHPIWLAAGNREITRKQFAEAEKYFRNAVQANPTNYLAWLQLSRLATGLAADGNRDVKVSPEQRQAAIEILKQALAHEELKNELLLRVELVRQQLQSPEATQVDEANQGIRELKSQFQTLPPELGVPLQLELTVLESTIDADAGNFAKASQQLESVLTSSDVRNMKVGSGLLSSAWLALGSYYEQQGLGDKASECFQQGATLEPASIPTVMYQAFTAERANNSSVAADLYEDVAARLGNRPDPWLALARNEFRQQLSIAASQRDFSRFITALEKARGLGAQKTELAVIDSEFAAVRGDNTKSLSILEEAASLHPESPEIWRALAIRRQSLGDTAGAADALTQYRAKTPDKLQAVLLEVDFLGRVNDWGNAERVLTEALQSTTSPEEQRQLNGQLVQVYLVNNRPEAAQELLEKFAKQNPFDINVQAQLGNLYWVQQRLDLMEQAERELRKLEGESGDLWRELRGRRLLQLAAQTQDEVERSTFLTEAKSVIQTLSPQSANRPQIQILLGRLAQQERRFADAAQHFEIAWSLGERTVLSATELIFALQSAGDLVKQETYLEQMQNLLPLSPQLYDLALAAKSQASFADLGKATEIAQNWVQSLADADSYLRLARTLSFSNRPGGSRRTPPQLDQIESAYRKAIELNPKNPQSWGEFLRFLYQERQAPFLMIAELNGLMKQSDVPELDRSFLTAQLLTEVGFPQQAARWWNHSIDLVATTSNKRTQNRVLTLAAQFFTGTDVTRAIEIARQAAAQNLDDTASLRLLTALLSDTNTEASLKEASSLLDAIQKAGEKAGNGQAPDADKRVMASVLYRRAVLMPAEYNAADDLRQAAALMNSLKPSTEADAVQLARIVSAQGDKQAALLALAEQARRTGAGVPAMRAFAEYWQDNFADKSTMKDRYEQVLETLENTRGTEIVALDLRLRPAGLTSQEIDDIVRQFLTRVVTRLPEATSQDTLLQQTFAVLSRRNLQEVTLHLVSEDLAPLTETQKLNALLLVTIPSPGSAEFEASLKDLLNTRLPVLDNATLDRAAADYYFMRASWAEAEQYYQQCLKRDPKDVAAANNLSLVVVELRADFEEADKLIQQALSVMADNNSPPGSNAFLLDTQSQLLLAADKMNQALEILTPLSESPVADASVFLHLAACYQKMGKVEEAKQALAIAQQLGMTATSILPPMDKRTYDELTDTHTKQASK